MKGVELTAFTEEAKHPVYQKENAMGYMCDKSHPVLPNSNPPSAWSLS